LAALEAGVSVKNLDRLRVSLHAPVVDGRFRHQGNKIQADPLPKNNVFGHDVSFHFAFHFDVKNLQRFLRLERDHFRRRIHDGRVRRDGAPNGVHRVGHVDDDNLVGVPDLLSDTDEFVRLHGEAVEANIGGADPDISQL